MHPLEFIAYNLRPQQKVNLHYKKWRHGEATTEKISCFFQGFKHKYAPASTIIYSMSDLRPIFTLPTKSGGPGRRHVEDYILFEDIISLDPDMSGDVISVIYPEEIQGYMQGADKPGDVALKQIYDIADEMAGLFDGKAIQLNDPLGIATVYERRGGVDYAYPVEIVGVSFDRDALRLDLELGGEYFNGKKAYENVFVHDPVYLLSELMEAIRNPSYDEPLEGFLDLAGMDWNDIPECDRSHRVLYETWLLMKLRTDKWFASLTDEQKWGAFQFNEAWIRNFFLTGEGREAESFAEAVDYFWGTLNELAKCDFFIRALHRKDAA